MLQAAAQGCCDDALQGCRDSETLQPDSELCQALSMTTMMFEFLLSHRPACPQPTDQCHAMLEGALLKLSKLHCTVADAHPWSLDSTGTLLPYLQLCCKVAEHETASGLSWQKVVCRSLHFVDIVLRSPHYRHEERVVSLRPQVRFDTEARATACSKDVPPKSVLRTLTSTIKHAPGACQAADCEPQAP